MSTEIHRQSRMLDWSPMLSRFLDFLKMQRNDLRKFVSSSTFAVGFVLSAVYFFDVELAVVATFLLASGLLVLSMIALALIIFLIANKFRKNRKALFNLNFDDQKK